MSVSVYVCVGLEVCVCAFNISTIRVENASVLLVHFELIYEFGYGFGSEHVHSYIYHDSYRAIPGIRK